jgi:hypothetical protein
MSILHPTASIESEFVALVVFSVVTAALIYCALWARQGISRSRALFFGVALIILAGVDMFLLRILANLARLSPSVFIGALFESEVTVALCLLPTLFAGTGINVVSHLVIQPMALDRSTIRNAAPDPVSSQVEEPAPSPELQTSVAEVPAPSTHQTSS